MIDARQREISCRAVIEVLVRHAAHNRQSIGDAGDLWHMLAELDAGNRRCDRLERAAHIERGAGLGIPHIDLALPAICEDENYRLRAAKAWKATRRLVGSRSLLRKPQPPTAEPPGPNAQPIAARDVAGGQSAIESESQHGKSDSNVPTRISPTH